MFILIKITAAHWYTACDGGGGQLSSIISLPPPPPPPPPGSCCMSYQRQYTVHVHQSVLLSIAASLAYPSRSSLLESTCGSMHCQIHIHILALHSPAIVNSSSSIAVGQAELCIKLLLTLSLPTSAIYILCQIDAFLFGACKLGAVQFGAFQFGSFRIFAPMLIQYAIFFLRRSVICASFLLLVNISIYFCAFSLLLLSALCQFGTYYFGGSVCEALNLT